MRHIRKPVSVRATPPKDEASGRMHRITFCRPCGAAVPFEALVCHACGARASLHPWIECGQIRMD